MSGRRRSRGQLALAVALATCALALGLGGGSAPAGAAIPGGIVDRYLTRRPAVGPVTVVHIEGATGGERLLAATLQGIVNRTTARVYLVGARPPAEDQYWLDHYAADGLITVVADVDLAGALTAFASEAAGYVVASEAEPWTINTATTAAAALGGVVVTPDLIGLAQSHGLTQLDDHRGRWPDAATAYEGAAATYRAALPYQGLAIEQPTQHAPRDLFVQQGIMAVYTRPSAPDYDRVYALLDAYPPGHPVYGYISDTGVEEVQALVRLAQADRFLVPTDGNDNLSFHLAVGADRPRRRVDPPSTAGTAPCTTDQVNVVLAITDGDNLALPAGVYTRGGYWPSGQRGTLPMGWSIGESASVLMPAIWDHFAASATPNDEIVGMMGVGYGLPSLMPHGASVLADGFTLDQELGVASHWSLDALLSDPGAPSWTMVQAAIGASGHRPRTFLLNYADFGGPNWFVRPDGMAVLESRQVSYDDGPAQVAAQVQALVDLPPAQRPLVTFLPLTVWRVSYDGIVAAMAPFSAQGVRFLTPAQAAACLPAPPPTTSTSTTVPVPVVTPAFTG